jgi:hypothetical protein
MQGRRRIIGLSIVSAGMLGVISLFQIGLLKHLPPKCGILDAEAVHGSRRAFALLGGTPDGVLGMGSYVATASLAAIGPPNRVTTMPALPLALGAKCLLDAVLSTWFSASQWKDFRKLSPWTMVIAAATVGSLAAVTPEIRVTVHRLVRNRAHN